jgi:RNA polymerase sigma factor (TIGR02999 family)
MDSPLEITELLLAWEQGDQSAFDRLMPLVEKELRRLASGYLRKERAGHTLQTTALINEAYIKLVDQKRVHWKSRGHFFGIAALCMRRILLGHARAKLSEKRGGMVEHVALSDAPPLSVEKSLELLALDEALQKLAEQDEQQGRIVELRYFGGNNMEEIAEILGVSESTVNREWRMARAWLQHALNAKPKTK